MRLETPSMHYLPIIYYADEGGADAPDPRSRRSNNGQVQIVGALSGG